ncbi:monovalent cation/H(+) antiporter subunit G [Halomicrobium urmianum]|uniref:monovalent cation/H(+) antiporter subunit G n=1 Tax=Halomicrobium urmianum TaxID=1586233 RepID=UPI001CDA1CB6|nr:monovalent cation/H(+) antiporter subunit G [Halomicrobium urmianum]
MNALSWLAVALALAGAFFGLVAVVGLVRLPDVYTRTHAASKSDTLGAVLTLAAVAVTIQAQLATIKVVLLLLFVFLTSPTAAHAITRAARDQGIEPWTETEGGDQS